MAAINGKTNLEAFVAATVPSHATLYNTSIIVLNVILVLYVTTRSASELGFCFSRWRRGLNAILPLHISSTVESRVRGYLRDNFLFALRFPSHFSTKALKQFLVQFF